MTVMTQDQLTQIKRKSLDEHGELNDKTLRALLRFKFKLILRENIPLPLEDMIVEKILNNYQEWSNQDVDYEVRALIIKGLSYVQEELYQMSYLSITNGSN